MPRVSSLLTTDSSPLFAADSSLLLLYLRWQKKRFSTTVFPSSGCWCDKSFLLGEQQLSSPAVTLCCPLATARRSTCCYLHALCPSGTSSLTATSTWTFSPTLKLAARRIQLFHLAVEYLICRRTLSSLLGAIFYFFVVCYNSSLWIL